MLLNRICIAALVTCTLTGAALAQGTPFEPQYNVSGGQIGPSARIIMPANLHPEAAVSRELAAQPVHPYMVKVVLNDVSPFTNGAVTHTWIDPLQRLDGPGGLDENHSLVRAQRLYLGLSGMSTEDINEIRYQSWRQQQELAGASRARIIVNPRSAVITNIDQATGEPKPLMIIPAPAKDVPQTIPSVPQNPQPHDDRLMAAKD